MANFVCVCMLALVVSKNNSDDDVTVIGSFIKKMQEQIIKAARKYLALKWKLVNTWKWLDRILINKRKKEVSRIEKCILNNSIW